jgi:hypothetical protein
VAIRPQDVRGRPCSSNSWRRCQRPRGRRAAHSGLARQPGGSFAVTAPWHYQPAASHAPTRPAPSRPAGRLPPGRAPPPAGGCRIGEAQCVLVGRLEAVASGPGAAVARGGRSWPAGRRGRQGARQGRPAVSRTHLHEAGPRARPRHSSGGPSLQQRNEHAGDPPRAAVVPRSSTRAGRRAQSPRGPASAPAPTATPVDLRT